MIQFQLEIVRVKGDETDELLFDESLSSTLRVIDVNRWPLSLFRFLAFSGKYRLFRLVF